MLQQLDVQRVAWVGTSWGGIVGVHFAVRHPQKVRGLALMNTPFDMPAEGPGFSDRMVVWGARWIGNTDLYANGVARSFFPAAWRDSHPEELAAFVAAFKAPDPEGMAVAGPTDHRVLGRSCARAAHCHRPRTKPGGTGLL
ncbi:MAG: alpha/beta fold hydrolase, partial [bacterium]